MTRRVTSSELTLVDALINRNNTQVGIIVNKKMADNGVPSTNLGRAGTVEGPVKTVDTAARLDYSGSPWFSGWMVRRLEEL
jgi:hypothetical protein